MTPRYTIGTQFLGRGKYPAICTVIDIWTTHNHAGEVMHYRYVASHMFLGQSMREIDIPEATVARGIEYLREKGVKP